MELIVDARLGFDRLGVDQEISSALAYASLLSVLADSPLYRLSTPQS